ncbi:hypothetical protein [Streptosporangium sp. NPDC049046]|uniref:hypothetical protein n=1 Tax=Streptosporangium sp. NPDC049046 TaxID=3155031 RepID=UPI003419CF08
MSSDIEDWISHLLSRPRPPAHSTVRNHQREPALFCEYPIDPRYGRAEQCEQHLDTHPVQLCHEWNTARHRSSCEGRPQVRPLTRSELQRFFDHLDERVVQIRARGRKGWLTAFRDAILFKVVYGWGYAEGRPPCSIWPISAGTLGLVSSAPIGPVASATTRRSTGRRLGGAPC